MLLPDAGDIAWVDLDPVRGTEQAGRRPALVVSPRLYHEGVRRALVCPITRKVRNWPSEVVLPMGLRTQGAILVDQIRSVDRAERLLDIVDRVPAQVLEAVRLKLAALLGIEFATAARNIDL